MINIDADIVVGTVGAVAHMHFKGKGLGVGDYRHPEGRAHGIGVVERHGQRAAGLRPRIGQGGRTAVGVARTGRRQRHHLPVDRVLVGTGIGDRRYIGAQGAVVAEVGVYFGNGGNVPQRPFEKRREEERLLVAPPRLVLGSERTVLFGHLDRIGGRLRLQTAPFVLLSLDALFAA